MTNQLKIATRKTEPVFYLDKITTIDFKIYKDYFNTLNQNNLRPNIYGHEFFKNSYWFPFPWMFRESKYLELYNLDHLKKLKELYELSIPLFEAVENKLFNYKIIKLEINLMPPSTKIETHTDKWGVMSNCIRVHIPIQTNDQVLFKIGNNTYTIPEGQMFEFNNQIPHSIENNGDNVRVHYVFDLIEKEYLEDIEKEILSNGLLRPNHISTWTNFVRKEWQ